MEYREGRLRSYSHSGSSAVSGVVGPRRQARTRASSSRPIAKERCAPAATTGPVICSGIATASRLHFNLDFRINSQSLTACLTPAKAIGGRAWPNFIPEQDEWTLPLVLWSNTTLGLLAFWWVGTRQQQGRACLTITQLPRLTVLDPRALSKKQLAQADSIFEQFKEKEFLPANEAYRDDARQALDRAVLVELLHLSESAPRTARHFARPMVRRAKRPRR